MEGAIKVETIVFVSLAIMGGGLMLVLCLIAVIYHAVLGLRSRMVTQDGMSLVKAEIAANIQTSLSAAATKNAEDFAALNVALQKYASDVGAVQATNAAAMRQLDHMTSNLSKLYTNTLSTLVEKFTHSSDTSAPSAGELQQQTPTS